MPAEAARAAAETAARASYGRLLAFLAARSRDVAGAEDALSDAFRTALERWPEHGVPDRPEAWLLVAARRNLIHSARHGRVRAAAAETLRLAADEAAAGAGDDPTIFPDERLKLLFICAHPAIAESVRAPLMLQTVLGLDAARIASAFLVAPAAMGQRLVRAKAKIRDAGIAFEVPGPEMLAGRLHAVLEAIYAAYGSGWDDPTGLDPRRHDLAGEAIWLAQLIVELLPAEPEAKGLLALMLHCEARRPARRGPDGAFVPLTEQETGLWSRPMIETAERALAGAAALHRLGPFQLEAAIQSAHAERAVTGRTDWAAIADLYEGLAAIDPSAGVLVGRAVAIAEKGGPAAGLAALDDIPAVAAYQPYWAVRADLLRRLGRGAEARAAYTRAIGLSEDPAVRDFLGRRSAAPG
jgi:RNA polymerase sigma-70 factor (ECF subfamily)